MTPRKHKNFRQRPSAQSLHQINPHAAGIDIHAAVHWVAVPAESAPPPPPGHPVNLPAHVRRFGACTADLHQLADWLTQCGVKTVAMESTGIYWIPLFELLESRGFEVYLVDPRQSRHAPVGPRAMCSIANGCSVCIATACSPPRSVPPTKWWCCVVTCGSGRCFCATPDSMCSTCRKPWSR